MTFVQHYSKSYHSTRLTAHEPEQTLLWLLLCLRIWCISSAAKTEETNALPHRNAYPACFVLLSGWNPSSRAARIGRILMVTCIPFCLTG